MDRVCYICSAPVPADFDECPYCFGAGPKVLPVGWPRLVEPAPVSTPTTPAWEAMFLRWPQHVEIARVWNETYPWPKP